MPLLRTWIAEENDSFDKILHNQLIWLCTWNRGENNNWIEGYYHIERGDNLQPWEIDLLQRYQYPIEFEWMMSKNPIRIERVFVRIVDYEWCEYARKIRPSRLLVFLQRIINVEQSMIDRRNLREKLHSKCNRFAWEHSRVPWLLFPTRIVLIWNLSLKENVHRMNWNGLEELLRLSGYIQYNPGLFFMDSFFFSIDYTENNRLRSIKNKSTIWTDEQPMGISNGRGDDLYHQVNEEGKGMSWVSIRTLTSMESVHRHWNHHT